MGMRSECVVCIWQWWVVLFFSTSKLEVCRTVRGIFCGVEMAIIHGSETHLSLIEHDFQLLRIPE